MPDKLPQNKGQIMVEAIIAITVGLVGLLGVFSFISRSFGLNRVVADQYIGTYLAAEGIELVKNVVDQGVSKGNWNDVSLIPTCPLYQIDYNTALDCASDPPLRLKFDPVSGYYGSDTGGNFTRTITIDWPNADEVVVKSRVEWISRGGAKFDTELEGHFFNWRLKGI